MTPTPLHVLTVLLLAGMVGLVCWIVVLRRAAPDQPRELMLSEVMATMYTPQATADDWAREAKEHYRRSMVAFAEAIKQTPYGDPQTFDEWMRIAGYHTATGALAGRIERSEEDKEAARQ